MDFLVDPHELVHQLFVDCQAAGQVRSGDPVVLAVAATLLNAWIDAEANVEKADESQTATGEESEPDQLTAAR